MKFMDAATDMSDEVIFTLLIAGIAVTFVVILFLASRVRVDDEKYAAASRKTSAGAGMLLVSIGLSGLVLLPEHPGWPFPLAIIGGLVLLFRNRRRDI